MRFPSFPTLLRTFYTFAHATTRFHRPLHHRSIAPLNRPLLIKSMPSIPFLSSFFGTSTPQSEKMSFPVQKSRDEWQAVLNKGELDILPAMMIRCQTLIVNQINSVSCAKRGPRLHSPTNSISKCPMQASIPVQPATRLYIKPTINSSLAAAGQHISIQSLAQ